MEFVSWFIDLVLHLDKHLVELLRDYGFWVYLILFIIIFAETGFVVTPFLPGDSLLFAAGALAAVDSSGTLSAPLVSLTLVIAALAGNTTNYHVGRWIGPQAFSGKYRFLKVEYLRRTEAFFAKYGRMTIVMSRFVPIIRTCAPFVAGIGAHAVRALPVLQRGRRPRLGAAVRVGRVSSSATSRSSRTTSGW